MDFEEVWEKNKQSEKQCTKCVYYVPYYVDDYTLRHFGYGKVKVRPACTFGGGDGFVSHNPARLCNYYKIKEENNV